MSSNFGYKLPKQMHKEFADIIQSISEKQGEVSPEQIDNEFKNHYLDMKEPLHYKSSRITELSDHETNETTNAIIIYLKEGIEKHCEGEGNGPIDAAKNAICDKEGLDFSIIDYSEHALEKGSNAKAAAYICIMFDF